MITARAEDFVQGTSCPELGPRSVFLTAQTWNATATSLASVSQRSHYNSHSYLFISPELSPQHVRLNERRALPSPLERPWPPDWAHHQDLGLRAGLGGRKRRRK